MDAPDAREWVFAAGAYERLRKLFDAQTELRQIQRQEVTDGRRASSLFPFATCDETSRSVLLKRDELSPSFEQRGREFFQLVAAAVPHGKIVFPHCCGERSSKFVLERESSDPFRRRSSRGPFIVHAGNEPAFV